MLVITLLLAGLCTSQSTPSDSTSPAIVYTPGGVCDSCVLAAATAPASPNFSALTTGSSTASPNVSYAVFTAYSITSAYLSQELCVTTSGEPFPVSPPYSLPIPTSFPASEFDDIAAYSLASYLGFSTCTGAGVQVTPTDLIALTALTALTNNSLSTPLPSASSNSTEAPIPRNSTEVPVAGSHYHSLDEQAKIGIGVAIPIAATALLLLALLLWHRSRKIKKAKAREAEHMVPEENQPYLQQKAELEAEEKRKHELEAEERRYELDGESRIHEIADETSHGLQSPHVRQELKGEEHSGELEVP